MGVFKKLQSELQTFSDERDWDQFHSPKNLSMALSVEVSELLECFQWLTEQQSLNLTKNQHNDVIDEIADVQIYLMRLATKLDIDVMKAVELKIVKNNEKYPKDKVRGNAQKYTAYNSIDEKT